MVENKLYKNQNKIYDSGTTEEFSYKESYSLIGGCLAVGYRYQPFLKLATYHLPCAMGFHGKENKNENMK